MFGTTSITKARSTGGRTKANSKQAAYWTARAIDECLGGFLHSNAGPAMNGGTVSLLYNVAVEAFWRSNGYTESQGRNGAFQFSVRELSRSIGGEELKSRRGQDPSVTSGPPTNFAAMVEQEHERLTAMVDSGNVPPHWFYRVRFWNEKIGMQHAPDVPNIERAVDIGEPAEEILKRRGDTAAVVEYTEATDGQRDAILEVIRANLVALPGWSYRVPINLTSNVYADES